MGSDSHSLTVCVPAKCRSGGVLVLTEGFSAASVELCEGEDRVATGVSGVLGVVAEAVVAAGSTVVISAAVAAAEVAAVSWTGGCSLCRNENIQSKQRRGRCELVDGERCEGLNWKRVERVGKGEHSGVGKKEEGKDTKGGGTTFFFKIKALATTTITHSHSLTHRHNLDGIQWSLNGIVATSSLVVMMCPYEKPV